MPLHIPPFQPLFLLLCFFSPFHPIPFLLSFPFLYFPVLSFQSTTYRILMDQPFLFVLLPLCLPYSPISWSSLFSFFHCLSCATLFRHGHISPGTTENTTWSCQSCCTGSDSLFPLGWERSCRRSADCSSHQTTQYMLVKESEWINSVLN